MTRKLGLLIFLLYMILGLLVAPAFAQAGRVCRNFAFPYQGRTADGHPGLNTTVEIPPTGPGEAGKYTVELVYPAGALNFSLVKWMHAIHDQDVAQGRIFMWGLVDRAGGVPKAGQNAIVVDIFTNESVHRYDASRPDQRTSYAVTIPLSTPIHPGEGYSVATTNYSGRPVRMEQAIQVSVCFATQAEMNNYILYAEPGGQ